MILKAKLLISALLVYSVAAQSQIMSLKDSLTFQKPITDYSIDVSGNVYLAFEGGSITKYSSKLDSLFTYSPIKTGNISLLEAGSGLRIFAFYDFYQEYLITNRFLTQPVSTKLSDSSLDYVEIATQSQDNNIWLVENTGLRLIKYNPNTKTIDIESFLGSIIDSNNPDFTFVREYQNQVFLVDKNSGIYVFDNLGNYSKKIAAKTEKCSFYDDKIVYLQNNELVVSNLYSSGQTVEKLKVKNIKGALLYKNELYLIQTNKISHFQRL